ncbi:NFX1-type zinc finger-containing protein 1-like isoform X2 [Ranitomeya variabilis]|uniref:NFX1-type zinc finger-containing protein 1-like isoform X2 n=1 Tax=Ranitomeya variabilis TaxID=490064 RepID=UPI004056FA57
MEGEEDNVCEHPSIIDSDTSSENHTHQEIRENRDVENLTDTVKINSWRNKDKFETDNTKRIEKRGYRPTRDSAGRSELPDAYSIDNWRSTDNFETDNTNRIEKHGYRPTRDSAGRSELPDAYSIDNWRSTENFQTDNTNRLEKHGYRPTRDSADRSELPDAYSIDNWRSTAVPEEQYEESEETDKPIYDFTRQTKGARFSSQFGYNISRTREDHYNEESKQTEKSRYGFTRQNKGARFLSNTGFNSRYTRGNYKDEVNKYSMLKTLSTANYEEESKNEIRSHKTRKLGVLELSKMEMREPSEIILKLAAPCSGLKQLVNEASMTPELVKKLLAVLSKAIECRSSCQNLIHILSHILNSLFLKSILCSYIMQCGSSLQSEDLCSVVDHSLTVLTEILSIFPSSSFADVTIIKTLLENVVRQMEADSVTISEKTKQNMETLNLFLQHLQDKKQDGTLKADNYIYAVGKKGLVLGDDFRGVSVFPTHDDICMKGNPRLAPNIIDGSYPDVTSYLNTHFSLLREDFIGPLRDGISQYLRAQSDEDVNDIRLYFNVSILESFCVQSGIVYQVQFSTQHLKHIMWENSQRLLYGSLVCLSNDNFNSMLFATVAERTVADLQQGIITLMFEEESRQQLAKKADNECLFVMAETTAYFEAYCHTLQGLKEMKESDVPFQNYIIHCKPMMSPPAYLLHDGSSFTLSELEHKTSSDSSDEETSSDSSDEETYCNINKNKTIKPELNILDFDTWPTKEELGFDESQFEAFQKSLTSELSIIQGPPGTGKTYVGLKIVDALLKNGRTWRQGCNPILIVCYTNHALDQFLEGIYKSSHCKIVRVGSRSNSELIKTFSLNVLRRLKKTSIRLRRNFNDLSEFDDLEDEEEEEEKEEEVEDIEDTLQREVDILKSRILSRREIMESAYNTVIEEYEMKKYMNDETFLNFISNQERMRSSYILYDWLGLSLLYHTNFEKTENPSKEKEKLVDSTDNSESPENKEENIEVIKEPEIALLERQLDGDNISDELARIRASKSKDPTSKPITADQTTEHQNDDPSRKIKEKEIKLRQKMKVELLKMKIMSEDEYKKISDICAIPIYKRWEMYRMWRQTVLKAIRSDIFKLEDEYQILINRLAELRNQQDCEILQRTDIIGMTTTGAAKYRKLLQVVQPRIVIVEEAAEVLEAHIITTLSSRCQHLILIGDHQQLRPATTVYELAKNFNLEVSMFERLIRMGIPYVRLNLQHRMRPEIAKLLTPHIYDKLENHESVYKYDNIKGVCQNLFFVDHDHPEHHISEGKSRQNVHEAGFVKSLCLYFIQQGYSPSQITILTTYSGQLHCLQKMMPKAQFEGVRVCVVDKYQGEENDIIILSLVRSNLVGNVGFLKIPNRVCVALSRAKKGLYCIGNMQMLSRVPLWKKISEVLEENGQIGKELEVQCVNHPNTINCLSCSEDFDNVPEGGCLIPCEYRLDCGHVCALRCHPYDPKHTQIKCGKPCLKIVCKKGHKCKKICSEPCGNCQELVPKTIPICEHIQDLACSKIPERSDCREPCKVPKTFPCGHLCNNFCGASCPKQCTTKVPITLICGHKFWIECFLKSGLFVKVENSEEDTLFVGPCDTCLGIRIEKTQYAHLLRTTETHVLCSNVKYGINKYSSIYQNVKCFLHREETNIVERWQSELKTCVKKNEAVFSQVHNSGQMINAIERMQKTIAQTILADTKIKLLLKIGACKGKLKDLHLDVSQTDVATFTYSDYKNYQNIKEYVNLKTFQEAAGNEELGRIISILSDESSILSMNLLAPHRLPDSHPGRLSSNHSFHSRQLGTSSIFPHYRQIRQNRSIRW